MTVKPQEIPLVPVPQTMGVVLAGKPYKFRVYWNTAQGGSYCLDIGDSNGQILLAGIPLVSGIDLLDQFEYMGFGGKFIVTTDRGAGEYPTYDGLGTTSHLFFYPDA